MFVNPAADDFHLAAGSPARGTGLGGADIGVHFPVGGLPSDPTRLAAYADSTNLLQIWWQEDADNEGGFAIERSTNAVNWQALASVNANTTSYTDTSALLDQPYFYRVRATNSSGPPGFPISAAPPSTSDDARLRTLVNTTAWTRRWGRFSCAAMSSFPPM